MRCQFICSALAIVLPTMIGSYGFAEERVEFNRDIRPILSDKCFPCHGPNEGDRKTNLRFDITDDLEGPFAARSGSQAIKPGDLEGSPLWYRLTTDDPDEVMPPAESHKKPLTVQQRDLFRRWILQGAEYDDFWAFVTPKTQIPSDVRNRAWSTQRTDRFVMARLETEGLTPQLRADKRTLIRRVAFDLTGLPPTRDEIHEFLRDEAEQAWENLVDRLMERPEYGEHMAKYWLDLVRFSDTNGIHHDHYREMTPYRDWVIRSFNDNLNFDKFIRWQIAGDLHKLPTSDQQIASGFNRLHLVIDVGTALPEESFTRNVIDRVTAVGTAFMGLTVGCGVCHDHKYDPFTQKDFYQLYAFFNNIDADPETPSRNTSDHKQGLHAPFLRLPSPAQRRSLDLIEVEIADATSRIDELKAVLAILEKDGGAGSAESIEEGKAAAADRKRYEQELAGLVKQRESLHSVIPATLVMKEREEVRPTHILIRGAYDNPGERVERNTPAFLPPLNVRNEVPTRMDLAHWLTDQSNPLTARVTVNRFWQQFFGVGLVKTSEDFGAQGEWPSHPGLLDDLAIRFVESGWDVKALVKSIVMSRTYQQASRAPASAFLADPENRLLARGSRFRLDSELIRDQILSVSGLLNRDLYGKSVKPPQPPNLWKTVSMASSSTYSFEADTGDKIYRRSVYSFWKRAMPPPQMTIFDAPTRESCTARRERTNTPLQALVLMNERQYFKAAGHFARRLLDMDLTDQQRLLHTYEAVTSHLPDESELSSLRRGLDSLRVAYQDDLPSARAMTSDLEAFTDEERIQTAAHTMLINSLFSLDVTKTRE